MNNQANEAKLHEIATVLSCHQAFIVESIVKLQHALRDAQVQIKAAKEALK